MTKSDQELIADYQHGDSKALEMLFDRYKKPVLNYALRVTGNRADAEDVTSDVMMTIIEKKPTVDHLKVVLVGDLQHSRVANSWQLLASLMGVGELVLVAPDIWQPRPLHFGRLTHSLEEGLANADVVIVLRVQQERLLDKEQFDLATYRKQYALTSRTLSYAKPDAIVMHPGPMNRGVEIDSDVADGKQSVILQQVQNGVFMRMAILDAVQ